MPDSAVQSADTARARAHILTPSPFPGRDPLDATTPRSCAVPAPLDPAVAPSLPVPPTLTVPLSPAAAAPLDPTRPLPSSAPARLPCFLAQAVPLSVYVHIPWCVRKCPYCDFNSHPRRGAIPEAAFVARLLADLAADAALVPGRVVRSIFFGGGTPSLLSPRAIGAILEGIAQRLPVAADVEITLEANPGTAQEVTKLAGFRAAGVNRLSVGVQTLNTAGLVALGRIHGADEARRTLEAALHLFPRVNADLIYGWPGQTPKDAVADVKALVALGLGHVSAYELTLEPNTAFAHTPPAGLPDEETLVTIETEVHAALEAAGLRRYEVSTFARPGHECRHNRNYWQFGDYLGIGPGAHGKVTLPPGILRTRKPAHPTTYLQSSWQREAQWVHRKELPFEFLMNGLRLRDGVARATYVARTGQLPLAAEAPLAPFYRRSLLVPHPQRWQTTPSGMKHLNAILAALLPD